MKNFKRTIRLILFVCLIVLAALGIGLSGGVPLPFSNKRKDTPDINIELVESEDESTDLQEQKFK